MENDPTKSEPRAAGASSLEQLIRGIIEKKAKQLLALQTNGDSGREPPATPAPHPEPDDGGITVSSIIERRLDDLKLREKAGSISPRNVEKEKFYLNSFKESFGHLPLRSCKNSNIVTWLTAHEEWASSATKSDAVAVVLRCFKWAVEEGEIRYTPYHKPRRLIGPLRPRTAIDEKEYRAIMAAARVAGRHFGPRAMPGLPKVRRKRWKPGGLRIGKGRKKGVVMCARAFRLALWFLWETGARTCEVFSLEWDFICWKRGVAEFKKHKTDGAFDTARDRILPLSDRVLRLLRLMHKYRNPDVRFVFTSTWGAKPWNANLFSHRFRQFKKTAGIVKNISPYSLRHGFTVAAIEAGVGNKQIADMLGHTTTRFVDWYGSSSKKKTDYLRDSANSVHGRKRKPKPE